MTASAQPTSPQKEFIPVFGPYAASEVDRLRREQERLGPLTCQTADPFVQAEEQFRRFTAAHESINKLSRACTQLGADLGFPASVLWPRVNDLGQWGKPSQLATLGFELVELWSAMYQIDAGQILNRIQVAGIYSQLRDFLRLSSRPERDLARGAAILTAIQQFYVIEWQRLKIEPFLSRLATDELQRTVAIVARHLQGEGSILSQPAETRSQTMLSGNVNVAPLAGLVANAPLALWRAAHHQVTSEKLAEQRIAKLIPDFERLGCAFDGCYKAATARGPASVALEGIGVILPHQQATMVVADVLEKLPGEKGPAMI